jgi:LPXTG-motif cell wall-anchored protein
MVLPRVRVAAVLAALLAAASVVSIPAHTAAAAAPAGDVGLYGSTDPTYDGVYRQSLAILGLEATGQQPNAAAVTWLLDQQCADGAFTAYRADTSAPCETKLEDENATAAAIQALVALGHGTDKPISAALAALMRFQRPDGGFYDSAAFGPPAADANSTGLALSAFTAAGVDRTTVTNNGKDGDEFLRSIQLGCDAATGAGGFDFQPEKTLVANDFATAQALLGQLGTALPLAPPPASGPMIGQGDAVPTCVGPTDRQSSADAAAAYLVKRLTETNGAIPAVGGKGTDWTTTSFAVLDLVAAGAGSAPIGPALAALQAGAAGYARGGGVAQAGALGTLLLVAHATGTDPRSFGGLELAGELVAAERTAPSTQVPPPTALPRTGGHTGTLAMLGGLLVLAGGLAVATSRRLGR